MRLSDAIRKGCTIYPEQAFFAFQYGDKACALGAAYAGYFGKVGSGGVINWETMFPVLTRSEVCPCLNCENKWVRPLDDVIVHLNDEHRWTREAIADWVETLEMGEMPAAAAQPTAMLQAEPA